MPLAHTNAMVPVMPGGSMVVVMGRVRVCAVALVIHGPHAPYVHTQSRRLHVCDSDRAGQAAPEPTAAVKTWRKRVALPLPHTGEQEEKGDQSLT